MGTMNTLTGLALSLGLGESTLRVMKARHAGFPAPALDTGTIRLYDADTIVEWLDARQKRKQDADNQEQVCRSALLQRVAPPFGRAD